MAVFRGEEHAIGGSYGAAAKFQINGGDCRRREYSSRVLAHEHHGIRANYASGVAGVIAVIPNFDFQSAVGGVVEKWAGA